MLAYTTRSVHTTINSSGWSSDPSSIHHHNLQPSPTLHMFAATPTRNNGSALESCEKKEGKCELNSLLGDIGRLRNSSTEAPWF
ncbi:hypothetical protein C5167_006562 [Papaver somniferum]|uniref:Uncharacterized protein n=1 Tax=Papaver somniferum TaxID=3469 RepID=A0A4Y7JHM7_PAPSO|nr:hypothetical protein C5167_006562 [Papaver somniferum]